jgi:hypothetical protein
MPDLSTPPHKPGVGWRFGEQPILCIEVEAVVEEMHSSQQRRGRAAINGRVSVDDSGNEL